MKKAALIINAVGAGLAFLMMIYCGIILGIRMDTITQNEMAALVGVIVVYAITMLLNLLFVKSNLLLYYRYQFPIELYYLQHYTTIPISYLAIVKTKKQYY